jgi:uncharacterized protein (DUF427 family)
MVSQNFHCLGRPGTPLAAAEGVGQKGRKALSSTFIMVGVREIDMKAVWNNQVIAEADKDKLIYIEGNWYFPPDAVKKQYFESSETHTACPWKGEASYYNVAADGQTNQDAAWYYPEPKPSAIDMVKKDFTNYVAFWRGVQVT